MAFSSSLFVVAENEIELKGINVRLIGPTPFRILCKIKFRTQQGDLMCLCEMVYGVCFTYAGGLSVGRGCRNQSGPHTQYWGERGRTLKMVLCISPAFDPYRVTGTLQEHGRQSRNARIMILSNAERDTLWRVHALKTLYVCVRGPAVILCWDKLTCIFSPLLPH